MVVTFREEKEKNEKMIQQNTQLRNQVPKIEKSDIESENRHSDDITLSLSFFCCLTSDTCTYTYTEHTQCTDAAGDVEEESREPEPRDGRESNVTRGSEY